MATLLSQQSARPSAAEYITRSRRPLWAAEQALRHVQGVQVLYMLCVCMMCVRSVCALMCAFCMCIMRVCPLFACILRLFSSCVGSFPYCSCSSRHHCPTVPPQSHSPLSRRRAHVGPALRVIYLIHSLCQDRGDVVYPIGLPALTLTPHWPASISFIIRGQG